VVSLIQYEQSSPGSQSVSCRGNHSTSSNSNLTGPHYEYSPSHLSQSTLDSPVTPHVLGELLHPVPTPRPGRGREFASMSVPEAAVHEHRDSGRQDEYIWTPWQTLIPRRRRKPGSAQYGHYAPLRTGVVSSNTCHDAASGCAIHSVSQSQPNSIPESQSRHKVQTTCSRSGGHASTHIVPRVPGLFVVSSSLSPQLFRKACSSDRRGRP